MVMDRLGRTKNVVWAVIIFLIVASPLSLSFEYVRLASRIDHTARTAFIESCNGTNTVRHEVVSFVISTVTRSERATQATLTAPSSTPGQRAAATKNLAQVRDFEKQILVALMPKDCTYPPALSP